MKDSWFENFLEEHLKTMEKTNLATTMKYLTIILLFATILTGKAQITIQDSPEFPSAFLTETTNSTYLIERDTVDYIVLYLYNIEQGYTLTHRVSCIRTGHYEYVDCSNWEDLVYRKCKVFVPHTSIWLRDGLASGIDTLDEKKILLKWLVSDLED